MHVPAGFAGVRMQWTPPGAVGHQESPAAHAGGGRAQSHGTQYPTPGSGEVACRGGGLIKGSMSRKTTTKMTAKRTSRKSPGKRMTWTWVLIMFLFISELLFYTYCRVQCVQVGIAISTERGRQRELTALQNSLKIELARLKAPERISVIARKNLGLGMPDPAQIIMVP